jgi:hypothetical protein
VARPWQAHAPGTCYSALLAVRLASVFTLLAAGATGLIIPWLAARFRPKAHNSERTMVLVMRHPARPPWVNGGLRGLPFLLHFAAGDGQP